MSETMTAPMQTSQQEQARAGRHFRPNVDIVETANELIVHADMPGVQRDDIDIRFDDGELTIHGHVQPRQPAGQSYMLQQYEVGHFHRTFRLGEHVDAEKIRAEFARGVLTLHLPKHESARPRKIAVQGA